MSFTVSANTGLVKGFPLVKAVWLQNHCVIAFFYYFLGFLKISFHMQTFMLLPGFFAFQTVLPM